MKKSPYNGNFRKVEREGGEIVDYYQRHFWHEDIQNTPHYIVQLCTKIGLEPLQKQKIFMIQELTAEEQ